MAKRILFLVPYPLGESPSQRFRFEQYFTLLQRRGYPFFVQSFLNSDNWRTFSDPGNHIKKAVALLYGFAKRFIILFKSPMYDFVFIHREAAPLGPPLFEWILVRIFRRKIIYDFDDAIWLTDKKNESWALKIFKWRRKVSLTCKLAYRISCGNDYLCKYAMFYNNNVILNPTTLDTELLHNPAFVTKMPRTDKKIRIGWTGSYSTLKYLQEIETLVQKTLDKNSNVEFVVVADRPPSLKSLSNFKFIKWNKETEIKDLLQFDIGIMPLPDDEWSKGKCGFKALQYMALEIPAVVSPVGVNSRIVDHGINGFLCNTAEEWYDALAKLITHADLRKSMGSAGRKKVLDNYSVLSNTKTFLSLFE